MELQEDYIKQEGKQNTVQGNTASAKSEPRDFTVDVLKAKLNDLCVWLYTGGLRFI